MLNTLFSICEFLDHVKDESGIKTDYKLAQALGSTQAAVSAWRRKIALPNAQSVVKLCELSGDDPELICVQIMAASAKDEVSQKLWLSVEKRLRKARQIDAIATIDAIELEAFE